MRILSTAEELRWKVRKGPRFQDKAGGSEDAFSVSSGGKAVGSEPAFPPEGNAVCM